MVVIIIIIMIVPGRCKGLNNVEPELASEREAQFTTTGDEITSAPTP